MLLPCNVHVHVVPATEPPFFARLTEDPPPRALEYPLHETEYVPAKPAVKTPEQVSSPPSFRFVAECVTLS